jgi:D-beta-D-heptose 7-phosphate kinase / D-beta-D-heptose 1-phosphate adenosyltransferase
MSGPRIVVIGDVVLDVDLVGRSERLAPDAPVPVVRDAVAQNRPGGAALAAALTAARDGAGSVTLVAPFAADPAAEIVRTMLADRLEVAALDYRGSTPVKTRIRSGDHAIARIDSGASPGEIADVPPAVGRAIAQADAILVSDYGRGTAADPRLRRHLADAARHRPVLWDPHPSGPDPVAHTLVATPNEAELWQRVGAQPDASIAEIAGAAGRLVDRWRTAAVAVTRGAQGAVLVDAETGPLVVPAAAQQGRDTCGAGDCLAANLAVEIAAGQVLSDAIVAAVAEATRYVRDGGAGRWQHYHAGARTHPSDLAGASPQALAETVRANGGTVVATGGCFDLLHAGHVRTLEAARALGDCLIVCLNSDASVRRLKGAGRPLQPDTDRVRVLSALHSVDAVLVFDQDTPVDAIRALRPHIWVKGGDYHAGDLPEAGVLAEWGATTVTVPYLWGRSTTTLVGRLHAARAAGSGR